MMTPYRLRFLFLSSTRVLAFTIILCPHPSVRLIPFCLHHCICIRPRSFRPFPWTETLGESDAALDHDSPHTPATLFLIHLLLHCPLLPVSLYRALIKTREHGPYPCLCSSAARHFTRIRDFRDPAAPEPHVMLLPFLFCNHPSAPQFFPEPKWNSSEVHLYQLNPALYELLS